MPKNITILEGFVAQLQLFHYAPSTIKTYSYVLYSFLRAFSKHKLSSIGEKQIDQYLLELQEQKNISIAYKKQILTVIKKFYLWTFNRVLKMGSISPRENPERLPKYLTTNEIKLLLNCCKNLKHLAILQLLYGCGLRVSEVVRLKIEDIDFTRLRIVVRVNSNRFDRYLPLPQKLLHHLPLYYRDFRPREYLFEGRGKRKYSIKSIQNFVKKYAKKASIEKNVTPQNLRHSYAIHQLEKGIHIRYVQTLLGHKSIKTTERYFLILNLDQTQIANPLDQLL